jgi:hypothetical protein
MTAVQQLQNEMNEMNKKRKAVIAANTVESDFPELKKTFSYRKHIVVRAFESIV